MELLYRLARSLVSAGYIDKDYFLHCVEQAAQKHTPTPEDLAHVDELIAIIENKSPA